MKKPFTKDIQTEARLLALEAMMSVVMGQLFKMSFGATALEESKKLRSAMWDRFSSFPLDGLPPEQAKQMEAELRDAFDKLYRIAQDGL